MTHKTGGSGRSRIYTVLRMKEAHNRYATLPYLVDRVGIEPTGGCLQSILVPLHTAQIWCSHSESNQVIRITKPAHHHLCFESKFILKHTHTSAIINSPRLCAVQICFKINWSRHRDSNSDSPGKSRIF